MKGRECLEETRLSRVVGTDQDMDWSQIERDVPQGLEVLGLKGSDHEGIISVSRAARPPGSSLSPTPHGAKSGPLR